MQASQHSIGETSGAYSIPSFVVRSITTKVVPAHKGKEQRMKREPDTPMGTVVLIAIFLIMTVVLWFNVYFIVLSRGAN